MSSTQTKKATRPKKVSALKLNLGGAPATPHVIPGLPGFYHPEKPTPVGERGECSLDRAKEAAKDEGCHVELVSITANQAAKLREEWAEFRNESLRAIKRTAADADGAETEQVKDEAAALSGEEG